MSNNTLPNLRHSTFLSLLLLLLLLRIINRYKSWVRNADRIKVDVVYKYIDLRDPDLKREGFVQLEKDYDNEELRYSIRSVYENIPWVNKIYIIMPNEKVRFLYDSKERKKKIIYIKDKDILGFDSSSSITFEHAALKNLKRYGVSDTFIYMNDDCFIGRHLRKKDLFYYSESQRRFVPFLMPHCKYTYTDRYDYYYAYYNNYSYLLSEPCNQSSLEYFFQTSLSTLFLYKYFNRTDIKVFEHEYNVWHNSLPLSIEDTEELYEVVKNNYEYADVLFNAKERDNKQMTFETLYSLYFLNKYNREIGNITKRFYRTTEAYKMNKKRSDMFVLNKSNNNVTVIDNIKCKYKMIVNFRNRIKEEKTEIDDGIYYIHSTFNDSLAFAVKEGFLFKKYITLQPFENKKSQQFYVEYGKDGFYYLYSMYYRRYVVNIFSKRYLTHTLSLRRYKHKNEIRWLFVPFYDNIFYFASMENHKFLRLTKRFLSTDVMLKFKNLKIDERFLFRLEKL